ncbi:MAG: aryl-sulfate sulfotransferase [Anaerolineae bacterium]|jgi:hypothetical protein|nr:aryl-sulfate sulfotransferase [Anaerolineae bacterium]
MTTFLRVSLLATAWLVFGSLLSPLHVTQPLEPALPYAYLSPQPGATHVSPLTSIAVRPGDQLDPAGVSDGLFRVTGSRSGLHSGRAALAGDGATVVFIPDRPFWPGETVRAAVAPGLIKVTGQTLPGVSFQFATWNERPPQVSALGELGPAGQGTGEVLAAAPNPLAKYLTLPGDFPFINVTVPTTDTTPGYYFLSNLAMHHPYLLMIDGTGDPLYYLRLRPQRHALDFKVQPNGLMTYYDSLPGVFYGVDQTYTVVRTFRAGNGYYTDHHDLQVLPNGHYLVMIWDTQVVDMSKIVPNGNPDAHVIGLIIQELDAAGLVVFEWRSWDHLDIRESYDDLTGPVVDPFHGNSVEMDRDGNLLVSMRNCDQVLKINRQTGDIIWRLGGKKNEFTLQGDVQFFHRQHDARRLPNGRLTLFDNRAEQTPQYSRGIEYQLDEAAKTVTRVWEYRNTPDVYGPWLGNTQRLPNGNTVIGWGLGLPAVTETQPDGTKVFEMSLANNWERSYRVFRFPWQGRPPWPPAIAVSRDGGRMLLHFSYNGATEIASYRVLAGTGFEPDTAITTVPRTRFEDTLDVTTASEEYCSFRVMPLDRVGKETHLSAKVYSSRCVPFDQYLPFASVR